MIVCREPMCLRQPITCNPMHRQQTTVHRRASVAPPRERRRRPHMTEPLAQRERGRAGTIGTSDIAPMATALASQEHGQRC